MRLRRAGAVAAVAGAAAAVVFATTAAVTPSGRADPMQPLPTFTSQALAARYAADSHAIARATTAATRSGDTGLARALDDMHGRHFLSFDARGSGEAIEVLGDLATAKRVAIIVPGSDTTLATFNSRGTASPGGAAVALAAQAHRLDPGAHLAVIAWLGYNTPATFSPAVMTSGDAEQGARALRPLVTGLAARGDHVALLCHSYGSVVCGLAAPHLPVTDIAAFGSPGMDASSARALHTGARVWAGRGRGDWIRYVPHVQLLGLGFGQDPTAPAFGARPFACGTGGHSGYFRPRGVALRNLAYIALGDPAGVTR
ncbi:MAG TPA: alpha/beta hydrolase [Streptosporangiaceae bacterium]|nr:alpha/beta hydrolase [Streptosporangiaceae bacterium]